MGAYVLTVFTIDVIGEGGLFTETEESIVESDDFGILKNERG